MQSWVDLLGLLHTEMVYLPQDGHPFKYQVGPTCVNFVYAMNSANHYAMPPTFIQRVKWCHSNLWLWSPAADKSAAEQDAVNNRISVSEVAVWCEQHGLVREDLLYYSDKTELAKIRNDAIVTLCMNSEMISANCKKIIKLPELK